MNKEEVYAVLKKYIMEQLEGELKDTDIAFGKAMNDLGANSLDIVEIVSNTMRELKVKVPREELARLKNIGELVEKITYYKNLQDAKDIDNLITGR